MRRLLLQGLLVVNSWAGACDLAPNFHDALQWKFDKEWEPCSLTHSAPNWRCLTLKETPQQILKRLPEYAKWPGAEHYKWDYGDPLRGQFYDHYHVNIRPLKTGSLVILREETGPIVALSMQLGSMYKNAFSDSAKDGACIIPLDLKSVVKSCQAIRIPREGDSLPALQLTLSKSFGNNIRAGKNYVYYLSHICPIAQLELIP